VLLSTRRKHERTITNLFRNLKLDLHLFQQYFTPQPWNKTRVEASWNVMAHAQKPDFVFRRNGGVHLNQRARQFSRLLAAELCTSAVVMLDTPRSEVVWKGTGYPLHSPSFPFTSPPVRRHMPSHFNWSLKPTSVQIPPKHTHHSLNNSFPWMFQIVQPNVREISWPATARKHQRDSHA